MGWEGNKSCERQSSAVRITSINMIEQPSQRHYGFNQTGTNGNEPMFVFPWKKKFNVFGNAFICFLRWLIPLLISAPKTRSWSRQLFTRETSMRSLPKGKKHVFVLCLFSFGILAFIGQLTEWSQARSHRRVQSEGTTSSRGGIKGKLEESTGRHVWHTTGSCRFPAMVLNRICDHDASTASGVRRSDTNYICTKQL